MFARRICSSALSKPPVATVCVRRMFTRCSATGANGVTAAVAIRSSLVAVRSWSEGWSVRRAPVPVRGFSTSAASDAPPSPLGASGIASELSPSEADVIRKWLAGFSVESIPDSELDLSFSRSSGPGGQNVNKVSTKVDLRFKLADAAWLHPFVRARLAIQDASRINKNGEYVITSTRYRTQPKNRDDARQKLFDAIQSCGADLPNETSVAKQEKIKELVSKSRDARLANKRHRSDLKQSRRMQSDD